MTSAATAQLRPESLVLSPVELELYHLVNDYRVARGLPALKPVSGLTAVAGQHAWDFDANVGYANWVGRDVAARPVPSLHHWSDGSDFAAGVVSLARAFQLRLPTLGLSENAGGLDDPAGAASRGPAAQARAIFDLWLANPATRVNLDSPTWDTIGVGVSGAMGYATFGDEADQGGSAPVPAIVGTTGRDLLRATGWADQLSGGLGNDTFLGLGPGDVADGGAGLDSAVLQGPRSAYQVAASGQGGPLTLTSADGSVTLRDVEYLVFQDRVADAGSLGGAGVAVAFDAAYYLARNPDVASAVAGSAAGAADHYWQYGRTEGRAPSPFFDEAFYLRANPDVAAAVKSGALLSGFAHYLVAGQFELRAPNPYFSPGVYRAANPDVAAAIATGDVASELDHYLRFGRYEGRLATSQFDEAYYLRVNPDVAAAVAAGALPSGLEHYRLLGQVEGRLPFEWIDAG